MGVHPVRHKPNLVYAARITDTNIHALAEGIRDETGDTQSALVYSHEVKIDEEVKRIPRLYLKCDKGQGRVADLGDVLIRGTVGEFYAISYEVYLNTYEDVVQDG
jgi:hypothetical protein